MTGRSLDSGTEIVRRFRRLGRALNEYVRLSELARDAAREFSKYQISARCGMRRVGEKAGWAICALSAEKSISKALNGG
jgi:hypothetical protein